VSLSGPNASSAAALSGKLRELSGFEEDLVARWAPNAARAANEALAHCLAPPGEDPGDLRDQVRALSVVDRDLLLLELRRRSVGDEVRSEVDCPACGSSSELAFRLSDLPSSTRPAATVEVELPNGRRLLLRPVTAGDQELLLDQDGGSLVDVLALALTTLDGQALSREEIDGLGEEARTRLAEALDRANPDLDIRLSLRCCACGRELETAFDVEGFFLPS